MQQSRENLGKNEYKKVQVLTPYPVEKAYDYFLPEGVKLEVGDYVLVPLGKKKTLGVVWADKGSNEVDDSRIKFIETRYDFPPMSAVQRKFIEWVANYTMYELGSILKMCLSSESAFDVPKRARLKETPCKMDKVQPNNLNFSESQQKVVDNLRALVDEDKFATALLDGVTGSGKTEVYFEAVARALEKGKQVLVLLPEIFLSAQFLERFERRFGIKPAVWHSEVTPAQKRITFTGVAKGETKVIVGARSALFLPYADLGLIVVDEEHEASFKQEEGVLYNARDMAIVRASLSNAPIVLVSATPSLETIQNVNQGKYKYFNLPSRFAGAKMPEIHIIDLKKNRPRRGKYISPIIEEALIKNFERKEQSLLFLNRRGYAPLTLCRNCGYRFQCPSCSAWLVEHKRTGSLQCHHCGYHHKLPDKCPECGAKDEFAACGPGVERINEEVQALIPDAVTKILASDIVTSKKMIDDAVKEIEDGKIDIIIGTQIIAKGNHFPALTLVGVIDADLGLEGGDLRAGEHSFQLLQQVSGRAGRANKLGTVFVQTYMPDNMIIKAMAENDRNKFFEVELREREAAVMPPFGRLASLIISSKDEELMDNFCYALLKKAPRFDDIRILGPAPAPMAILRGKHRRRFLIKAERHVNMQKFIKEWLAMFKVPSSIRLKIDIDPQSFF